MRANSAPPMFNFSQHFHLDSQASRSPPMCLNFHDISAWISCGNEILDNYSIERSRDACHITCWIASRPGEAFSVNWKNERRIIPLSGHVFLDNIMCYQHHMLDCITRPEDHYNTAMISSNYTSPWMQRNFIFPPEIDSNQAEEAPRGSIRLEIWRLQVIRVIQQPGRFDMDSTRTYSLEHNSPTPLVDLVYGASLGDAPYVTFTFNYAPIESLRDWGIAPPAQPLVKPIKFRHDPFTEERLEKLRSGQGTSRTGTSTRNRQAAKRQARMKKICGKTYTVRASPASE